MSEHQIIGKAFQDTFGEQFHNNTDAAYSVFKEGWKQAINHHQIANPTLFSNKEWDAIATEAVKANPEPEERFFELTITEYLEIAKSLGFNEHVKGNIVNAEWLVKYSRKLYLAMLARK